MKLLIPSLGLLAATLLPCSGQLVINEVMASTTGSDTEFVELHNTGAEPVDLADWSIEIYESDNQSSFGALDSEVVIASGSIPAGGYFVLGSPEFETIYGYLSDHPIPDNFVENSSLTMILRDALDNVAYSVFITDGGAGDTANESGTPIVPDLTVGPDGTFIPAGYALTPDAGTEILVLEFSPRPAPSATPGAANPVPGGPLSVTLDVSTLSEGDASSFITGTVTVPAEVSSEVTVTVTLNDATEAITTDTTIFPGSDSGIFIITAVDDAWPDGDQTVTVTAEAPTYDPASEPFTITDDDTEFLVIINEVYNQVDGIGSDANGDGLADQNDEFVEIINVSGGPLDLSGATLADSSFDRHYFPVGTVLEEGCALLVFSGGGIPEGSTAAFGNAPVQFALSDPAFPGLRLNDTGDSVTLIDTLGSISGIFAGELHSVILPDQSAEATASSITTASDADAATGYILHTSTSGASPHSPGTSPDNTPYCTLDQSLALAIAPGPYTEEDGSVGAAGTVSIPVALGRDLFVYLQSSDNGELDLSGVSPVLIPSGQTLANFDLQFVDDTLVDGTQTVTVNARAVGYLNGETTIDVEDGGDSPTFTDLVINEIDAQNEGTDSEEFIELFNKTDAVQPLDGLLLVLFNGNGDASYDAIDLTGYSIPANGFFVLGSPIVPNVDYAYFTTNGLQNGADAVALIAGTAADYPNGTPVSSITGVLVDAVVYDDGGASDPELLAALTPGQGVATEDGGTGGNFVDSTSRVPDGGTAFNTSSYIAQLATPGATNSLASGSFASWAAVNGIAGQPFDGDFDGDSIPNGAEYGIDGLNPTRHDRLTFDGTTLSFTKRPLAVANGDVGYAIEQSTDLGVTDDWTEVSGAGYTNDGTSISYDLPGGQTRIFTRLRIEELGVGP